MILAKKVYEYTFQMILQGYNLYLVLVLGNVVKMQKSTHQQNKQTKKGDSFLWNKTQ